LALLPWRAVPGENAKYAVVVKKEKKMKEFIAACVQIAITPNDVKANIAKSVAWLEQAVRENDAELIVFPETVTTGFVTTLEVGELWDLLDDTLITAEIQKAAKSHGVHIVWPTYRRGPERGVIYNSSILIGPDGGIIGTYDKTHPFPLERAVCGGWVTVGNRAEVFETALGSIGMIICYDGDFPELSRILAVKGAEIITRPSALLRSFDIWNLTTSARAYDNHVYMVATNSVGPDAGGGYYFGHSMIVNPIAWRLAQARGSEEIVSAKLDPDPLRHVTWGSKSLQMFDHLEDRNIELYKESLAEARSRFEIGKRLPRNG
jgi:predicted amidohydrolase